MATSPKYQLPKCLTSEAAPIAEELRRRIPDRPGHHDVHSHLHSGGTTMIGPGFVKRYCDPDRPAAARAHRDCWRGLECGVRLPALRSADSRNFRLTDDGVSIVDSTT